MSLRPLPRFALIGLLAATLAAPAVAQVPNPWRVSAPEPVRLRAAGVSFALPPLVEIDVDFGPANPVLPPDRAKGVIEVECRVARSAPVAIPPDDFQLFTERVNPTAMPGQVLRPVVAPPCCAFDCPQRLAPVSGVAPMPRPADAPACGASSPTWAYTGPGTINCQPNPWVVHPTPQAGRTEPGPQPCCDKASYKPTGTWYRDLDGAVIAATFAKDELKLCMTQNADGHEVRVTLTAEYAVTKEGLVHGVVTGADVEVTGGKAGGCGPVFGMELAGFAAELQELVDCPFSFRMKHTSAGVMVTRLRVGGIPGKELSAGDMPVTAFLCGMYKPAADGKVPDPKPMKTYLGGLTRREGTACAGGMPLPSPHSPQYFPADPAFPLHRELASQDAPPCVPVVVCPNPPPCPGGWCPRQPGNVPAVEFDMMAEAFGQMLGLNPTYALPQPVKDPNVLLCPPAAAGPHPAAPPCPPAVATPAPVYGPGLLPTTGNGPWNPPPVAETTMVRVPPPAAPAVCPPCPPCPLPTTTRPSVVGTWVREVGPVVYVVKVEPDHLTITAAAAAEVEGGKVVSEGLVITADYHLGRDGATLVGLVTGVDATLDGPLPEGANFENLGHELERVQKALTDQPIAMTVRVYGDVLVIGNVRLPQVEGHPGSLSPVAVLGGRYKALPDGKALPKPRPAKVYVPRDSGGLPMANPPHATPPIQQPPGAVPPGDLIPPTSVPPPAPTAPPPPVDTPKPGKKGKKQKYVEDPNVRMQQLLYQSEGLRQLHEEWKRFWFNDPPSHLTPERIHGGIM
jgi:hypothetical protein